MRKLTKTALRPCVKGFDRMHIVGLCMISQIPAMILHTYSHLTVQKSTIIRILLHMHSLLYRITDLTLASGRKYERWLLN